MFSGECSNPCAIGGSKVYLSNKLNLWENEVVGWNILRISLTLKLENATRNCFRHFCRWLMYYLWIYGKLIYSKKKAVCNIMIESFSIQQAPFLWKRWIKKIYFRHQCLLLKHGSIFNKYDDNWEYKIW